MQPCFISVVQQTALTGRLSNSACRDPWVNGLLRFRNSHIGWQRFKLRDQAADAAQALGFLPVHGDEVGEGADRLALSASCDPFSMIVTAVSHAFFARARVVFRAHRDGGRLRFRCGSSAGRPYQAEADGHQESGAFHGFDVPFFNSGWSHSCGKQALTGRPSTRKSRGFLRG